MYGGQRGNDCKQWFFATVLGTRLGYIRSRDGKVPIDWMGLVCALRIVKGSTGGTGGTGLAAFGVIPGVAHQVYR